MAHIRTGPQKHRGPVNEQPLWKDHGPCKGRTHGSIVTYIRSEQITRNVTIGSDLEKKHEWKEVLASHVLH